MLQEYGSTVSSQSGIPRRTAPWCTDDVGDLVRGTEIELKVATTTRGPLACILTSLQARLSHGASTIPWYAEDGWSVRTFAGSNLLDPGIPFRANTWNAHRDVLYPVVLAGSPTDMVASRSTLTGHHRANYVVA